VPSLSPSSRLVLAALAAAFLVLVVVGAARPQTAGPSGTPLAAGVAVEPSLDSPATPSLGIPTGPAPTPTASSAAPSNATASAPKATPTTRPTTCEPTDQDRYVYNPDRLDVQDACIRVTGTVEAVRREADGDLHILLAVDPAFAQLLTPANQGEELGDLVVEPVCVKPVTQTDAIAICAADPDPLAGPFPLVGDRIWMEGRYVFDLEHGGWAELHPLYRWDYR
jgi:hypothetical protein